MHTLAIAGGVIAVISHLIWIRGILKDEMHLNLATWILFTVFDFSVLAASISAGAPAPFLPLGFAIGASLIVVTLVFKGTWRWGYLETACSAVAVISLVGWVLSGPVVAIILLTVGKYSAEIPTVVRGYQRPERKQSWVWFLSAFGAATNIFAGGSWTITQSLFPTVAFLSSAIVGFVHLRRPVSNPKLEARS